MGNVGLEKESGYVECTVDGYPGSLFGAGHAHQCLVSEMSIPTPVVSKDKRLKALKTAKTLQPFADIIAVTGPDGKPQRTR